MFKFRFSALIMLAMLCAPGFGWAQTEQDVAIDSAHKVQAVTLYPYSAKIEVMGKALPKKLSSGEMVLVAYLPGSSNPNTLSANIDGKLTGMNIEQLSKEDSSDPILAPWKTALLTAQNEHDRIQAMQQAVQASIALWSKPGMPRSNIASELENLDIAMQTGLKTANEQLLKLKPLLEQATRKLSLAQSNLNELSPSFKISFILAELRTDSDFSYSYMLDKCGWHPSYTLNALPNAGKIEFGFSAQITQNSGFDWKDIKVSLATNAPSLNITPPNLDRWHIRETPPPARVKRMLAKVSRSNMLIQEDANLFASPQTPKESLFATFSIWDMGKRTLSHNKTVVLSVMDDSLESDFLYTARPNVSEQAFLTAAIKPKAAARILPRAKAVFLVEGNTVGNAYYPPKDKEDLFFGTNPLVKVSSKELTNQSDERGLIGKTQIRSWIWQYEVENLSQKSIILQVEDSIPSLADKRMKIKLSSTPMPEIDKLKSLYIWRTTLEPQAKFEIEQKIEASAPANLGLDSSR